MGVIWEFEDMHFKGCTTFHRFCSIVPLSLCDGNILPLSLIFCQNVRMFPVYCTLNRTLLSESSLQYSDVNEVYSIAFYGSIWICNTDLTVVWFVKAIGHFQKYHNSFPAKVFPIDE